MTGIAQLFLDIKNRILSIATFTYTSFFNGAGLNDAGFLGAYTGANPATQNATFEIKIDSVGTIDTFKITSSAGIQTGVAITGVRQWLGNGLSVIFQAVTGHTLNDTWTLTVTGEQVVKFCQVWNNQTRDEADGKMYDYPKPAVFVEFANLEDIEQLGNGNQIYNDMTVRLHVVQDFYNATDGNGIEEQNLTIFDLTQQVYRALNKFEPTGAAAMVRTGEQQQSDHTNIYEFIQDYKTNLIDLSIDEPVGFIIKPPTTDYHLDIYGTDPTPDLQLTTNETFAGIYVDFTGDLIIDWGDGTVETVTGTGNKLHNYASAGTYVVKARSKNINSVIALGTTDIQTVDILPEAMQAVQFSQCLNLLSIDATGAINCTDFYAEYNPLIPQFDTIGLQKATTVSMVENVLLKSFNPRGLVACNNLILAGCALGVANVDEVLQAMDDYGISNGTLFINNQIPFATPTNITAKNNLLTKGWTIQTD